jgi:hypothetical protein
MSEATQGLVALCAFVCLVFAWGSYGDYLEAKKTGSVWHKVLGILMMFGFFAAAAFCIYNLIT